MKYKCHKCSHEWLARIEALPQQCPKCKSYNWNKLKEETPEIVTADKLIGDLPDDGVQE